MKTFLPVLLVLVVVGVLGYFLLSERAGPATTEAPTEAPLQSTAGVDPFVPSPQHRQSFADDDYDDDDDFFDFDIKPATQLYNSSAEALEAIKKAAVDYDDLVLEQFSNPGQDCQWCPEFYGRIRDLLVGDDVSEDERSFFGEILAISNRVENIELLVDAAANAPTEEMQEAFMESLELIVGDDQVVRVLGERLRESNDEMLQESIVAALTNHGSALSLDQLYQYTVAKGDPDGFYSVGVGLGEAIWEPETIPLATEILYRDEKFAPLVFKSMLNSDFEGFKVALTYLDDKADQADLLQKVLEDSMDHVICGEDTEGYCRQRVAANPKAPVLKFCQEVLEECGANQDDDF